MRDHLERWPKNWLPSEANTGESWPISAKTVANIYYSPMIRGWAVDLAGTGETVNIFPTQEQARAWIWDLLR